MQLYTVDSNREQVAIDVINYVVEIWVKMASQEVTFNLVNKNLYMMIYKE